MEIYSTMEEFENELYHHGIKGQRWGIRRFQNADGSLTDAGKKRYMKDAKFRAKVDAAKPVVKPQPKPKVETAEERHARLMKSTNANELMKNVNELSNEEIRERIQRIQLEQQLAQYVKKEPTKMDKAMAAVDKFSKVANKAAEFTNSPAGKIIVNEIKKQAGLDKVEEKVTDYKSFIKDINKKSDKQIQDMANRIKNEKLIKQFYDDINEASNANQKAKNKDSNQNVNATDEQASTKRKGNFQQYTHSTPAGSNDKQTNANARPWTRVGNKRRVDDRWSNQPETHTGSENTNTNTNRENQNANTERSRNTSNENRTYRPDGVYGTGNSHRSEHRTSPIDVDYTEVHDDVRTTLDRWAPSRGSYDTNTTISDYRRMTNGDIPSLPDSISNLPIVWDPNRRR